MDKLFQENLGDFREQPDPRVWNRIRNSLDQKKKSRAIPVWWRWGAAAAILLGILFLTTPWKSPEPALPAVTNTAPDQDKLDSGNPNGTDTSEKGDMQQDNAVADVDRATPVQPGENSENTTPARAVPPGEQVAERGDKTNLGKATEGSPASSAYAAQEASENTVLSGSSDRSEAVAAEQAVVSVAEQETRSDQLRPQTTIAENQNDQDETDANAEMSEKKSIFDAIEESKAVAENEEEGAKWSLGPSVAPVYFNSFGNGSPIASNFVNNSKSGSVNLSYGLQVSYKLSERLRVRSGVHKVDYGYNTEDVGFTSSPSAQPSSLIRTISYSEESRNLVVQSMVGEQQPMEPAAVDVSAPNPAREGQMVQEFGYLEIPLEMQYSLIDKKWGVDLIGGMSSLFLVNNSVSLESDGSVTEMGEATNINSLKFSTNFGLGFFYRFNPSFELNLQPLARRII